MNNAEQLFLNELDNKFWKAADKLRANMDAANYKHVVLGLRKVRISRSFLPKLTR
ncbi:type I restriction-modification system subunit M N-terminal domain-containing protein [Klebsiella pneumoniae]